MENSKECDEDDIRILCFEDQKRQPYAKAAL